MFSRSSYRRKLRIGITKGKNSSDTGLKLIYQKKGKKDKDRTRNSLNYHSSIMMSLG